MRVLAIDCGLKRTGIAVSDAEQRFAFPLCTVESSRLLVFLKDYMGKESVQSCVLGFPTDLKGRSTDATAWVEQVECRLRVLFPKLALVRVDERLTSKMARQTLHLAGYKQKVKEQKENIDKISAALILQTFLAQSNKTAAP